MGIMFVCLQGRDVERGDDRNKVAYLVLLTEVLGNDGRKPVETL